MDGIDVGEDRNKRESYREGQKWEEEFLERTEMGGKLSGRTVL